MKSSRIILIAAVASVTIWVGFMFFYVKNLPPEKEVAPSYVPSSTTSQSKPLPLESAKIPVGPRPISLALDSANNKIYVTSYATHAVTVIDSTTNTVVGNPIPVGINPEGIVFDSSNGNLYVTNTKSNSVSVINGTTDTFVANITVGSEPSEIAFDSANGNLYVANEFDNTVSVIKGTTNTVIGTIQVGVHPDAIGFDPANGNLYVTNYEVSTISVINGATNKVIGNPISVGKNPAGVAFDSANGNLYVTNFGGSSVTVLNDATNTVVSTIPVGVQPLGIVFDSGNGNLYITNYGGSTISVINGTTNKVVGTIQVDQNPFKIILDSAKGNLYLTNQANSIVSVIPIAKVVVIHNNMMSTSVTCNSGNFDNFAQTFIFHQQEDSIDVGTTGLNNENDPFSIVAWINPIASAINNNQEMVIMADGATQNGYGNGEFFTYLSIIGINGTGALATEIGATQTWSAEKITDSAIAKGRWSFVALTYDGSRTPDGIKLYINGTEQPTTISGSGFTGVSTPRDEWAIGEQKSGPYNFNHFEGSIDEVKLFTCVISPDQVQKIYLEHIVGKQ